MFLLLTLNIFHIFASVSIVDFEQVNVRERPYRKRFQFCVNSVIDLVIFPTVIDERGLLQN